jgi:hypothetical protein
MNGVTGFTQPTVNGTFNGWSGTANPLTDANNDGIWELVIALPAGTYEYKFAADSWNIQESLTPGSSCTVTNFGFTNRTVTVSSDIVLDAVDQMVVEMIGEYGYKMTLNKEKLGKTKVLELTFDNTGRPIWDNPLELVADDDYFPF